jgi:nucleotide-binding universal stress UspA family protein
MHSRCDATAVVMSQHDTATAILEVAALDEADVVVVGHRPHVGSADRELDVAAAVIERCTASVLLVPLPDRFA